MLEFTIQELLLLLTLRSNPYVLITFYIINNLFLYSLQFLFRCHLFSFEDDDEQTFIFYYLNILVKASNSFCYYLPLSYLNQE